MLCIAEVSGKNFRILEDVSQVTGLVKGVQKNAIVSEDNVSRALKVIHNFRSRILAQQVSEVKAVATEGLRKPANGEEIRKRLEAALGFPIQIIDGEREAELSFWSVQKTFLETNRLKLVFDIGGASTELILGDANGIQSKVSLKLGSVVLTEMFGLNTKSNPEKAMSFALEKIGASGISTVSASEALGIGVAGTMTTMIAMDQGITEFSREKVSGQSITRSRVDELLKQVCQRNLENRSDIQGLPKDRADIIGGGLCIALALCQFFSWEKLVCVDAGIRIGLLLDGLDGNLPA